MKGLRFSLALCVIGGVLLFGTERRGRAAGPIDEADSLAELPVVDGTVFSQVVAQASPAVSVERTQNHMMDVTPAGLGLISTRANTSVA